jgi:Protein of unknown function (DUF3710)
VSGRASRDVEELDDEPSVERSRPVTDRSTGRRGSGTASAGPYDVDDPAAAEVDGGLDFGSLRVPMPARAQLQVEQGAGELLRAVHVLVPSGRVSLSALAAPRSGQLWRGLAKEIADSLAKDGAKVWLEWGRWGREVLASSNGALSRFVGVDGPRWMLYGVATGPAHDADALAATLRHMIAGTVVTRGSAPLPVKTVLPLRLPEHLEERVEQARGESAHSSVTGSDPVVPVAPTDAPAPAQPGVGPAQPGVAVGQPAPAWLSARPTGRPSGAEPGPPRSGPVRPMQPPGRQPAHGVPAVGPVVPHHPGVQPAAASGPGTAATGRSIGARPVQQPPAATHRSAVQTGPVAPPAGPVGPLGGPVAPRVGTSTHRPPAGPPEAWSARPANPPTGAPGHRHGLPPVAGTGSFDISGAPSVSPAETTWSMARPVVSAEQVARQPAWALLNQAPMFWPHPTQELPRVPEPPDRGALDDTGPAGYPAHDAGPGRYEYAPSDLPTGPYPATDPAVGATGYPGTRPEDTSGMRPDAPEGPALLNTYDPLYDALIPGRPLPVDRPGRHRRPD